MPVTRRRLLEAAGTTGTVLITAGCLANDETSSADTPTGTDTQTDTPTATPASEATTTSEGRDRRVSVGQTVTVEDTSITVKNPRVRKAVVIEGMAHTRVIATEGQFVVVDVLIDGEQPEEVTNLDLWSSVDGEQLSGSDPLPSLIGKPEAYPFSFPAEHHEEAAILHTGENSRIYWSLPATVRDTLAREPKFTVPELEVLNHNGQLELNMTVANEGERDGVFKTRVSLDGFSGGSIVEFPVAAGESHTYTGRPDDILLYLENQGGGVLTVQYPTDDGLTTIERTVELSQTQTESTT
jgi:hypothetical protein